MRSDIYTQRHCCVRTCVKFYMAATAIVYSQPQNTVIFFWANCLWIINTWISAANSSHWCILDLHSAVESKLIGIIFILLIFCVWNEVTNTEVPSSFARQPSSVFVFVAVSPEEDVNWFCPERLAFLFFFQKRAIDKFEMVEDSKRDTWLSEM